MPTVTITGPSVRDSTSLKDNRPWFAFAAEYQDGGDGGVVTPRKSKPIYPSKGVLTIELEAGIAAWIQNPDGNKYLVTVPNTDSSLWDVIAAGVAYPPDTRTDVLATAVDQYVETARAQFRTRAVPVNPEDPNTLYQWEDETGASIGDPSPLAPNAFTYVATLANPTAVKTSAYTAVAHELVPADATAGGFTVTLPTSPSNGDVIAVKKLDATTNTVLVQRSGTDVFNQAGGPSSLQLVVQSETVIVQYKSGIWYVIYHGIPLAALDARYTTAGDIKDVNGNVIIELLAAAAAVNHLRVSNTALGTGRVEIEATGPDSSLDIWAKVKGLLGKFRIYSSNNTAALRAAGPGATVPLSIEVTGTTGVQVGQSNTIVNYLDILGTIAAGGRVTLTAKGSDTNVDFWFATQGNGKHRFYSPNNTPTIRAAGTGSDTDLTVECAGTGKMFAPTAPRVASITTSPTPSIDSNATDMCRITALAEAITGVTVSGTPRDGQTLWVRITAAGADRSITWGAAFVGVLLATALNGKTHWQQLRYDSVRSKWVGLTADTAGY